MRALLMATLLASPVLAAEDWNFTPADFTELRRQGRDLEFHPRSLWLPDAFRDNIKVTLTNLLDERRDPPSTTAVSTEDFFHGHIACERPNAVEELRSHLS